MDFFKYNLCFGTFCNPCTVFTASQDATMYKTQPTISKVFWRTQYPFTYLCEDFWEPCVYWTVRHLDSWIERDQPDVTCFIISLFNAQHVSDPQELATYLLSYFMGCIALVRFVLVLGCGLAGVV